MPLPAPARALTAALTDGVAAARAQDADAFGEAAARLAALDPALVAEVLGSVVRSLLEDAHPDGLDGEDLRAVLTGCTASARAWLSDVDPTVLGLVLTGALGLADPDEEGTPAAPPAAVARHATLLVAHLGTGRRPDAHLAAALAELARAQTVEMP